jgi:hypothetical protein
MPIVEWEPQDLQAPVVVAYSSARDMFEAIKEIDIWAHERGLVRAKENWLAPVLRQNRSLYRGACYPAPGIAELKMQEANLKEAEKRRAQMPFTTSSEKLHEDES